MNTTISEKHFKNASSRLRQKYSEQGVNISHAQSLQELSNILFEKPYEEVKKTILESQTKTNEKNVYILQGLSESILLLDREYVYGDFPGTDLNDGFKSLVHMGESLARKHNTHLQILPVPVEDIDYFETDDFIKRAEMMGYFSQQPSLLKTLITQNNLVFMVNGIHNPYNIDGEWMEQVSEEGPSACIWHMEMEQNMKKYEFFITFEELCSAKKVNDKTWIVKNKISNVESVDIEIHILS